MIPFITFIGLVAAAATTKSAVLVQPCETAEVYAFTRTSCHIALTNTGHSKVKISGIHAVDSDDSVAPSELILTAGEQAYVQLSFGAGGDVGNVRHTIVFSTDEEGHPEGKAVASAFVMSVLDDTRPVFDFGVVDAHAAPSAQRIEISSHDVADLRTTSILEAPDWLEASVDADGRAIEARVKPGAPWGLHVGFVKIALNAKVQPQAWIEAKADIHGDVVPASNPIDLGLMRIGNANEFRVPLRNRFGRSFDLGALKLEGIRGKVNRGPCERPGDTCAMLEIKVDEKDAGPLKGRVLVDLPDLHQQLEIRVWGLLVPADLKVKTVDPTTGQIPGAGASSASSINLDSAVREAVKNSENVMPSGTGPLLRWTIANGAAIHGFQVFRGIAENGPFVLLNKQTIPSKAQTQDAVEYSWRDTSATPGKTYWYSIGIVYNDGRKQQLTGPHPVVAK